MDLTPAEGRVLGCLIEKQVEGPAAYSLTLNELRYACNQSTNQVGGHERLVTYDDRTVEETLMSLKSKGLARFVPSTPSIRNHGPVRCRHRADERWRLNPTQLTVLGVLLLKGPLTLDVVCDLVDGHPLLETPGEVEATLDSLAARTPTPFATRLRPRAGSTEVLWAEVLTGVPAEHERLSADDPDATAEASVMPTAAAAEGSEGSEDAAGTSGAAGQMSESAASSAAGALVPSPFTMVELADRMSNIERRLAGIEAALGSLRSLIEEQGEQQLLSRPPG